MKLLSLFTVAALAANPGLAADPAQAAQPIEITCASPSETLVISVGVLSKHLGFQHFTRTAEGAEALVESGYLGGFAHGMTKNVSVHADDSFFGDTLTVNGQNTANYRIFRQETIHIELKKDGYKDEAPYLFEAFSIKADSSYYFDDEGPVAKEKFTDLKKSVCTVKGL